MLVGRCKFSGKPAEAKGCRHPFEPLSALCFEQGSILGLLHLELPEQQAVLGTEGEIFFVKEFIGLGEGIVDRF